MKTNYLNFKVISKKQCIVFSIIIFILIFPPVLRIICTSILLLDKKPEFTHQHLLDTKKKELQKSNLKMVKKLENKVPYGYYLVINSAMNEFSLYRKNQLIKHDKCSTGSYVLLKNGENQQWMFKTPKGEFKVRDKIVSPVWKKPDWAFVEEGLPVPAKDHHSRFEYGALGDYALNIGDGYLIHGTLYQRFIGLPVTHGCIRLNNENLELVYKHLSIGSKVYIY